MNTQPLISVVLCFYNEEKVIGDAIQSILSQTYTNFELLLIDDNSTDTSVKVCESFNDPRMRILSKGDEPKGLANSRNMGVVEAKGDFIIFQDADDISHNKRIAEYVHTLNSFEQWCIIGSWLNVRINGNDQLAKFPMSNESIRRGLNRSIKRNVIAGQVLLYPKAILLKYPYRNKFRFMQDYDQIFRVEENEDIPFVNIPKPLYTYILSDKGVKNNKEWPLYNYFVRVCKKLRKAGIDEPINITEFKTFLRSSKWEFLKWSLFQYLILFKIRFIENRK